MHISRRRLFQGSAAALGGTLCGPLLRNVWAAPAKPARVVLVVEGNGVFARALGSTSARAAINQRASRQLSATDFLWHSAYGHTSPLVVSNDTFATPSGSLASLSGSPGLASKAAVLLGLSSTVVGGGHSGFRGALSCTRGSAQATAGATIDALLAATLKGSTPFDALRLGVGDPGSRLSYNTCAFAPGRAAPITLDPTDAFNKIFGALSGSNPTAQAERKGLLDFAKQDITRALASFGGSTRERAKLEQYLTAVEEAQTRQTKLAALTNVVVPAGPSSNPAYQSSDPIEVLEVQFGLAKAALMGALTNVVVLVSGPGGGLKLNYQKVLQRHLPANETSIDRHTLQHAWTRGAQYADAILDVSSEHVRLVVDLARSLDAVPEGVGTMLDHTVIVYMSDNGEQHHSLAVEWPMLVLGGKALGMRTDGRTIVYPGEGKPGNRQVSNLFNTLGHAIGNTSLNTFGGEGSLRIAPGPLGTEIFG